MPLVTRVRGALCTLLRKMGPLIVVNIKRIGSASWLDIAAPLGLAMFFAIVLFILPVFARWSAADTFPEKLGWISVPHSTLQGVCPPSTAGYEFPGHCRYVIAAWNSAIADTKRNRMIIWGGGHADYFGNEVYAFDLNSLQMLRLNDPSPINSSGKCVETLSDGTPNSRHTYDSLAYIASADRMFAFGGSLNSCGFFSSATWTLDLQTLQWKNMAPSGDTPSALPGVVADYDPNSRLIFLHDTTAFWQYDYDGNRYRKLATQEPIDYHMSAVIDPKRKIFLILGAAAASGGGLKTISIAPGSNHSMKDWTGPATSTCGPLLTASYPGVAYDPVLDRVVGWPNFGDAVYLLNPDTKSCTTETFSGGPPDSDHQGSAHTSNGTYGRFRYFPERGVFVLVNEATTNTYILRLSAAGSELAR